MSECKKPVKAGHQQKVEAMFGLFAKINQVDAMKAELMEECERLVRETPELMVDALRPPRIAAPTRGNGPERHSRSAIRA